MKNFIERHKPEYTHRSKEFFGLAAPIFAEQIFVVLMGLITTVLVSRVDEYALSAASMVDSIGNLVLAFFGALAIGATIVVAQYTGRGDRKKTSNVAAQAVVLSAICGIIFCAFFAIFRTQVVNMLFRRAENAVIVDARLFLGIIAFSFPAVAIMMTTFGVLRGTGNTSVPMIITIIINIVNVVLGLILISRFGVAGAAFALLISRCIGAVLGMLYIVKRSMTIRFSSIKDFKPDFSVQKIVLRFGIPTSIESGTFQMGKLLITVFIAGMGTAAIAANAIVGSVSSILIAPGGSFSTGSTILIGQRIGRGNIDDVKKSAYFTVVAAMVVLLVVCTATFFMLGPIVSLFETTPEMLTILRPVLITLVIAMPIAWPSSFITPSALRATGDVKHAMVVAIASMVFVRVAFAWVLGVFFGLGILGVWISMYMDWVVRSVFFVNRVRSGKWMGKGVIE